MPIKIDCPRCMKVLSVPRKKAGEYAHCPECGGRFWVPAESAAGVRASDAVAPSPVSSPQSIPMPAVPPPAGAVGGPPQPSPPQPSPPQPSPPPSVAASPRKVARFISAETTESKLEIAEGGQLPDLQLQEAGKKKKETEASQGSSLNPLVLFAVLCLSVVSTIFLVLYEPEPMGDGSAKAKKDARDCIDDYYLHDVKSKRPPKLYQDLLREALQARAQKNYRKERSLYREVQRMLRAERPKGSKGLVGRRPSFEAPDPSDERLDEHLSILLDDG